jgi:hypothetical protein
MARSVVRHGADALLEFKLHSNDGRESASWLATKSVESDVLICEVRLSGGSLCHEDSHGGSELVARDLSVRVENLRRLDSVLSSWLDLPLAVQAETPLTIAVELGGRFDESIRFRLGDRPDTVSGQNFVATLEYSLLRLKGEFSFVTDQSCLRIFRDGISAALG